ncbi:hypothetical protein ACFP7A_01225 [Sporolactobacillus kofuensis]|uniref:Uncharacterized protein n=1 Tax=Sporolactobacillus kofuensis TaxID=269672 RepID=A0ABW1W9F2_9BACL|nr:hypothetical protein [Sporolactobacillus kofuensis]MCO7177019.1 hypothetical protein [Sporolactobacillus kofuensis]
MGASYASVQDVASALNLTPTATVTQSANAGDIQLYVDRPVSLPANALIIVGYKGQGSELATVKIASQQYITLQDPLSAAHGAGTILLDATLFPDVVEAASRLVDDLTLTPAEGWTYESVSAETHKVKADKNGDLTFSLNKTPVNAIQAISYQGMPFDDVYNIAPERAWFDDGSYIIHVFTGRDVPSLPLTMAKVTVTYTGGYTPDTMPADIKRSTAMLAARLWKEKDSGYSDVIGNTDFGILQYTQAAPKDVLAMLQRHKRVSL